MLRFITDLVQNETLAPCPIVVILPPALVRLLALYRLILLKAFGRVKLIYSLCNLYRIKKKTYRRQSRFVRTDPESTDVSGARVFGVLR